MKILVAIDTSSYAPRLINAICERPWPDNAVFCVVSVAELTTGWFSNADYASSELQAGIEANLKVYTEGVAMQLKKRLPGHTIYSDVLIGAPVEQIIRFADQFAADMIILGQQGTAGAGGLSLGCIAEAIVQKAHCTVEVVKPKVVSHPMADDRLLTSV